MKIDFTKENGILTVALDGRLDTITAPELEKLYNDGLVDTFSATHPHDEPFCQWEETDEIKPGIWHVMPITQGDHGSAIGLFEKKDVTHKFYKDLIDLLQKTEK